MAKKIITAGNHPVTWDKLQNAVSDINDNFDEVYAQSNLSNVTSSIVPTQNIAFDLGTPTNRFRDLYLSGTTIDLGGTKISATVGGGITVVGGVTSTATSTGVTSIGSQNGSFSFAWNDDVGPGFQSSFTIPAEIESSDYIEVYFGFQYLDPAGPGTGRFLTPGEYDISGTTLTIHVSPPAGTAGTVNCQGYLYWGIGDVWTVDTPGAIGPFPNGCELLSTAPEPTISSGDRATYDIILDGSDYLESIELLTSGADYPTWDNYKIVELKGPAEVLTLSDPDVTYAAGGGFYPRRISDGDLRSTWVYSSVGPFTATWTDGSRTVEIEYQIDTQINFGTSHTYAALIAADSYLITGDFVGADLFSDDARTQYPQMGFYIRYEDPELLIPITNWATDGLGNTEFRVGFVVDRFEQVLEIFPVLGEVVTATTPIPTSLFDLGIADGTTTSDVIGWDPGLGRWIKSTIAAVSGTDTIDDVLLRGSTTIRALTVGPLTSSSLVVDGTTVTGDWADITGKPTFATIATSGAYADLSGKPDLSVYQTTASAFPGTWTALSGKPTFATVATSGSYADLSGKPSLATVATSGSYTDLSSLPALKTVAVTGVYSDLTGKPTIPTTILNLGITDGTVGQVLTTNGSGGFSFTTVTGGSGGTGLGSRVSAGGTTASLANNATGSISITGYKTYMMYKINTNAAAWVRFYITDAARTADASRSQGIDPSAGAGVIAEVITAGSETVILSPGVLGYNDDATPTTTIYVAVTNLSGSTRTITVTATLLQLES
jgi:hypothetical protein